MIFISSVPEEKFLNQVRMEELYGPTTNKEAEAEKKALAPKKAAIGFSYDQDFKEPVNSKKKEEESDSEEDSDSDLDLGEKYTLPKY